MEKTVFEKSGYKNNFAMLPDGKKLNLGSSSYWIPEIYFRPEMFKSSNRSLHDSVIDCFNVYLSESKYWC